MTKMLSGKNVLNASAAGLLSVLLASTVSVAFPSATFAKSQHSKRTADNVRVADLGSIASAEAAGISPGISVDLSSESVETESDEAKSSRRGKIAKKEKAAKSEDKKADAASDAKAKDSDKATDKAAEKEKAPDKKAEKAAKAEAAKAEKEKAAAKAAASKTDEKKGGGFSLFSSSPKKPKESAKKGEPAGTAVKAVKPVQEEDPTKPKYKFDPALISVLKDINKSLKESEAVTKLEDPVQKLVAKLAGEALDKALSAPELHANRIVESKDKARMENAMSAESWDSGVIEVSPEFKASVVALWAKKVEGLLTVQIVGEYSGKIEGTERKLGEFITVITAHSAVDKGFDIQSQQDVNFWIGKVSELKIDCSSGKDTKDAASTEPQTKSYLMITSPITARKREFFAAMKDWEEKRTLAQKAEEEKKKQAELQVAVQAKQNEVTEALAQKVAEALMKSATGAKAAGAAVVATAKSGDTVNATSSGGTDTEKKSEGSPAGADAGTGAGASKAGDAGKTGDANQSADASKTSTTTTVVSSDDVTKSDRAQLDEAKKQLEEAKAQLEKVKKEELARTAKNASVNQPTPASANGSSSNSNNNSLATLFPDARNSRSSWDAPTAPAADRAASNAASIVYPARAVAGHYMTVAVLNPQNNQAEQFVGLSFNGAQLSTGDNGKVVFQIPEDAAPGYSMHLRLSSRPDESPAAIEILQPLAVPSTPQMPNLESVSPVVSGNGMLTIGGHSFDGIAERNRVIIDGTFDANVLVSSPVQLKAQLPAGIAAGQHSVCVSTAGLRSNPGAFELVTVDLAPAGPDTPKNDLKKLMVKVAGTQNKVRVKLVNQSPDVVKMLKGDELVVITSGGAANQVIVPVQRLRSGTYKIEAQLLI